MKAFKLGAVLAGLLTVQGCSWIESIDPANPEGKTEIELYNKAKDALVNGNYEEAVKDYDTLQSYFPYGPLAEQASVERAYAYFRFDEPLTAIAEIDRFIREFPRHRNTGYAWYLKGLINETRSKQMFDGLLTDAADRDTSNMQDAMNAYVHVIRNYPASKYATDAKKRLARLQNTMARSELKTAEYYLENDAPLAAVNRAKYIIEHYPETHAVRPALALMVNAYRAMGANDLADDALKVLKLNSIQEKS